MNNNEYKKYTPEYINNLIKYLHAPDTIEKKETKPEITSFFSTKLLDLGQKLTTEISRVKQKLDDGQWYDESKARQLVLDYINHPECTDALRTQHHKIVKIHERLIKIKREQGTWADGIDPELLQMQEPKIEDNKQMAFVPELEDFLGGNIFLPDVPEDKEFDLHDTPTIPLKDPKAKTYFFQRLNPLTSPSNRLLFHINADEFGKGSDLEGNNSSSVVKYLHDYIQAHYNNPSNSPSIFPEKLIKELDQAISLKNTFPVVNNSPNIISQFQDTQTRIHQAFESQSPLLLMGGWTAAPFGHAIYYEIIPTSNSSASFRLYNTGAGVDYHPAAEDGHALKYHTFVEWKGVAREALSSPYFLEALIELQNYLKDPNNELDTKYDEHDIYLGLKNLLKPKEIVQDSLSLAGKPPKSSKLFMKPQRSGVCAWKSLMALMRTNLELNDYKRFKCDIKLQSLIDFIQSPPTTVTLQDWRLVRNSYQHLCRAIVLLYHKQIIGEAYLDSIKPTLQSIYDWIQRHQDLNYKRHTEAIAFNYTPASETLPLENKHTQSKLLKETVQIQANKTVSTQPWHDLFESYKDIEYNPKIIDTNLDRLLDLSRYAWIHREDIGLHRGLLNAVSQLTLDEAYWTEAVAGQPEKAEKIIAQLGEIAHLYFKSCFTVPKSPIIFSEKIYVFYKLIYLQELLCRLGHPKSEWKDLSIFKSFNDDFLYRSKFHNLYLCFPDAKMHLEMNHILTALKQKQTKLCLNDIHEKDNTSLIHDGEYHQKAKMRFENLVRTSYPEIVQKIVSKHKFMNESYQNACIYASNDLPAWLKAMRDTGIACRYIEDGLIGPIDALDRQAHLHPNLNVEGNDEHSHVIIKFSGINGKVLNDPEVKKIKDNEILRFAKQYPEITSEALQRIINEDIGYGEHRKWNFFEAEKKYFTTQEKVLINTQAKQEKISLADEEFHELVRLFIDSDLQFIELMEYFSKHPGKLQSRDYQTLLSLCLFKLSSLDKNIHLLGTAERLSAFVHRNYSQSTEQNDISTAVFFLRLAHLLQGYFPKSEFLGSTTEKLITLLNRKSLEPQLKSLVYAELISQLSQKAELSEQEIAHLLAGSIFREENTSHPAETPIQQKQCREALIIHAKQIETYLNQGKPNHALLNRILKVLRPEAKDDKVWKTEVREGEFPSYATVDGAYTFYPLISKLISADAKVDIPISIRENPSFQELFPNVVRGRFYPGNIYSFEDKHGYETWVYPKSGLLIIEQCRKGQWYRFMPSETLLQDRNKSGLKSFIGSRYIVHHYNHWVKATPESKVEIFAADPFTGNFQYIINAQRLDEKAVQQERLNEIQKLKQNLIKLKGHLDADLFNQELKDRGLLDISTHSDIANFVSVYYKLNDIIHIKEGTHLGKPSSLLAGFEDPSYIQEWYDDKGSVKSLELPRFKLSFKPDPTNADRFHCDQFPGYALNAKDYIKELGMYPHYLLLSNAEGQRKVLLPQMHFSEPEKKEVLEPKFSLDRSLKREQVGPQKYLSFDVKKNGYLENKSRDANFYLLHVLSIVQEYDLAVMYLKKLGPKPSSYTKKEADALKFISQGGHRDAKGHTPITGDISGNGNVIQLYADYLLIKNKHSPHSQIPQEEKKLLRNHYDHYLNHYRQTTTLKLSEAEEIFILKTLLNDKFNTSHYLRLKELDASAAFNVHVPTISQGNSANALVDKVKTLEGFSIPQRFKSHPVSSKKPDEHVLLTRPNEALQNHFIYFYNQARTGTPQEKERLRHSLSYVRTIDNGKHAGMANFFEAVLDYPNAFPEPVEDPSERTPFSQQQMARDNALLSWTKKVKETALDKLSRMESLKTIVASELGDMTQADYRLDPIKTSRSALKPSLNLPSLTTLSEACKAANGFKEEQGHDKTSSQQSLIDLLEKNKSEDPLQKMENTRLLEDLKKYQTERPESSFSLAGHDLEAVKKILDKDSNQDLDQMKALDDQIITLANVMPKPSEITLHKLHLWGDLRKVITLEELIVCVAKNDFSSLLERNPALKAPDCDRLANLVGTFLLYATKHQQRLRAQSILKDIEALEKAQKNYPKSYEALIDRLGMEIPAKQWPNVENTLKDIDVLNKAQASYPKAREALIDRLGMEMSAQRAFKPEQKPAYLVFEYFADILIRPAQVKKLNKFLAGKISNPVMEMIMGSGKSKVLLPLLGLMRADGQDLSLLIVPQPLFESISQDTQTLLQGAFAQSLRSLHFDRHTHFTKDTLEAILDDIQNIKKNKECLIMTSKSVQCLILKFIEESLRHYNGPKKHQEFSTELKLLQKVLKTLSQSGYPLIDEADTVLNVLHEVNFSVGKRQSPKTHEIELLSELYNIVYENDTIKMLAQVESDPTSYKKAPILTEAHYFQNVQKSLATTMVERLGTMTFESASLTQKIHRFIRELDDAKHIHLLHYLLRDKEHLEEAQKFYDSLDEEVQDVLAFVGEQISHLLPYTLTRLCDEKYGLDEKSGEVLAIPYSATRTPNSGSQFSNPYITMNYTYQVYMKNGVTKELVEAQIHRLQEKAMREMADNGGKLAITETIAGKAFAKLKEQVDMPLFNYKPDQLDELVKFINSNPTIKRNLVSFILLPQLELFESKLSCNPLNLVGFFERASGFTGTLWNAISMHHRLSPKSEKGTDAKTLSLLWDYSRDNAISITEGSTSEMIKQLQDKSIDFDMISDAGGYFKQGDNKQISHTIAALKGKEVVYYNAGGEQTVSNESGDIPLAQTTLTEDNRLTFLDQSHTTGADVPQKLDAIGLVTIGRHMLLRDLLQSVWRLRGLNKSQRVRFVVSHEVAAIIRQKLQLKSTDPIQFEAILNFALANQAAQQGLDNYKALKQELANIPQLLLLSALMNSKLQPQARAQAFQYLQTYWLKPSIFTSRELYGQLTKDLPSEEVLKKDKTECLLTIKDIYAKLPWLAQIGPSQDYCLNEVEALFTRVQNSLPVMLQIPPKNMENDQTVEIEQEIKSETHKENQTQMENQSSLQNKDTPLAFVWGDKFRDFQSFSEALQVLRSLKDSYGAFRNSHHLRCFSIKEIPLFPLNSFLKNDMDLNAYRSAFEGIHLSVNVLEWSEDRNYFELLGSRRTDFHHLLVKDSKVTLLSHVEAEKYRNSPDYYNLTLGFNDPKKTPSKDEAYKIVKLKFLNGDSHFSLEEIAFLRVWFKSQGVDKMKNLYLKFILSGYPEKTTQYNNSTLQRLFAELSK